jgi:hypothetical protein
MTLSALGIFSAAGAGGGVALSDYELISSTILGSNTASVNFTGLGDYSSTYKHLQVRVVARTVRTEVNDSIITRFNADTGSSYAWHRLFGSGSSVSSGAGTTQTSILTGETSGNTNTTSAFMTTVIDILDPYSTTKNKTIRFLNGGAATFTHIQLGSGLWINTASVTSFQLLPLNSANFLTGSRFSLYGIRG